MLHPMTALNKVNNSAGPTAENQDSLSVAVGEPHPHSQGLWCMTIPPQSDPSSAKAGRNCVSVLTGLNKKILYKLDQVYVLVIASSQSLFVLLFLRKWEKMCCKYPVGLCFRFQAFVSVHSSCADLFYPAALVDWYLKLQQGAVYSS